MGIHFAERPIVSLGTGFDVQTDGVMDRPAVLGSDRKVLHPGRRTTAWALAADLFADIPVGTGGDQEFVGLLLVSFYQHGREVVRNEQGEEEVRPARTSGLGMAWEVGWRWRFLEPVLSVDWFRGRREGADILAVRPGWNFWIRRHAASVKVEAEVRKDGDLAGAPWRKRFEVQVQMVF